MIIYGQERLEMKIFKAFTLAEILITLGIIGIVAAMTIPNLMTNYFEKRTVNQLKAAQSIISRAIRLAGEELGEVESWGIQENSWSSNNAQIVANNLKPFLKIATDCGLSDSQRKCIPQNYKRLNGQKHDIDYATDTRYYKITLNNGSALWWKAGAEKISLITIWVDTNGNYPPNTYGKDLFVFSYENGGVRPWGAPDGDSSATVSCKKNSTGYGCAYPVLQTGKMDYLHNSK